MKTTLMKDNFVNSVELNQRLSTSPVLSSRQLGRKGILVEQYQGSLTSIETELPVLSEHLLKVASHPVCLTQKHVNRLPRLIRVDDLHQPDLFCRFVQTGNGNFAASICGSSARGAGKVDVAKNGFSDRGYRATGGLL